MSKITEKQSNFIAIICNELHIKKPKLHTKEQAKRFIKEHIDEYHESIDIYNEYCVFENNGW